MERNRTESEALRSSASSAVAAGALDGDVLHLFHWDPKFFPSFASMLENRLGIEGHRVLVEGAGNAVALPCWARHLDSRSRISAIRHYLREMSSCRATVIHGLFDVNLRCALSVRPDLARRAGWVIWGGDLYPRKHAGRGIRCVAKSVLLRSAVRALPFAITYLPEDVDFARRFAGFRGEMIDCLGYASNVFVGSPGPSRARRPSAPGAPLRVFVGNSATPESEHESAFDAIARARRADVEVHCILSYGDPGYAKAVTEVGKRRFGDRFHPILGFMSFEDFSALLESMDVAIFAHRRQQGMGTLIQLLGRGKRVLLRRDTSQYRHCRRLGLSFDDLDDPVMMPLADDLALANAKIVEEHHSPEALVKGWDRVIQRLRAGGG